MALSHTQDDLQYTEIAADDYVDIEPINENFEDLYSWLEEFYENTHYVKGQSVYYGSYTSAGYVSSSGEKLYFSIPLGHTCVASSVTVAGNFRVRQGGNYLVGDGSTYEAMPVTAQLNGGKDCVNCCATTTHTNSTLIWGKSGEGTNNAACGITIAEITIRFS